MKPVVAISAAAMLTAAEQAELGKQEQAIELAERDYIKVGRALEIINDKRLYRPKTFESYIQARFDHGKDWAYDRIKGAEVAANVGNSRYFPANLEQSLMLSALSPDDQRKAWKQAVDTARQRITAAHVAKCVEQILGRPPDAAPGEVSIQAMAAFSALPPEGQLEVLRRSEEAATAKSRQQGPARQAGGSNESDCIREIAAKVDRLKKIHAGLTNVADEADAKLDEYLEVISRADRMAA